MHELSVTESVLDIAQKHAQKANARLVTDVYLVIGQLSSIVDDSVQFYWDALTEDTLCQGSKLHFTRIAATLKCNSCGQEYPLQDQITPCPNCDGINISIITGEEFYIDSIDIET